MYHILQLYDFQFHEKKVLFSFKSLFQIILYNLSFPLIKHILSFLCFNFMKDLIAQIEWCIIQRKKYLEFSKNQHKPRTLTPPSLSPLTLYALGLCSIYRVRSYGLCSLPHYGQWDWNVRFLRGDGVFCWPCDCPLRVSRPRGGDGSGGGEGGGGGDGVGFPTLECWDGVAIQRPIRCDPCEWEPPPPPPHSLLPTPNLCNLANQLNKVHRKRRC